MIVKQANKTASAATKLECKDSEVSDKLFLLASIPATNKLTREEVKRLEDYEAEFDGYNSQFIKGFAILIRISEERLYRETYKTFEEYCRERWGISARHANRLMLADAVVENIKADQLVSNIPVAVPQNEAQSRELASLPADKQVDAAREVAKSTENPTAKDFKKAAKHVTCNLHSDQPKSEAGEPQKKPQITSYMPPKPSDSATSTRQDDEESYDRLVELVDQAQTQARSIPNCSDVTKQLGEIAKKVQQLKAKGTR